MIFDRVMAFAGLLLAGLLGLGMSVCGGGFTALTLVGLLHDRAAAGYAFLFLLIAVPSLVAGVFVLWAVWRRFKEIRTEAR